MTIESMRVVAVVVLCACMHHTRTTDGEGCGAGRCVPAAVRKTIDATLGPNAHITSEVEQGASVYEASTQTKLELELSDAGNVLATEVALPVAILPAAVVAAVAGTIAQAEVVIMATGVVFEVEVADV